MKIDIFDIFCMGIDYGQLLMEEERDGEEAVDAYGCFLTANKYLCPSGIAERRQPHSEKWRAAKKGSLDKLQNLFKELGARVVEVKR